jgi:hypothetical protein
MSRNPRNPYKGLSAEEVYRKFHWGTNPTHKKRVDIPGKPKNHEVSEIGLLTELHIDPLPGVKVPQVSVAGMTEEAAEKPNLETLGEIAVSLDDYNNNHVAFDAQHPFHRIYLILSDSSKNSAKKGLWKAGKKSINLNQLAKQAGGHHGEERDYPNIQVQPLGRLYYVTYFTLKQTDKESCKYIHRLGEEGGIEPILAVSEDGNLWIAGGSYDCPIPGIRR